MFKQFYNNKNTNRIEIFCYFAQMRIYVLPVWIKCMSLVILPKTGFTVDAIFCDVWVCCAPWHHFGANAYENSSWLHIHHTPNFRYLKLAPFLVEYAVRTCLSKPKDNAHRVMFLKNTTRTQNSPPHKHTQAHIDPLKSHTQHTLTHIKHRRLEICITLVVHNYY